MGTYADDVDRNYKQQQLSKKAATDPVTAFYGIYKIVGLLHKHFLGCAVSILLDNEALLRAVHLR